MALSDTTEINKPLLLTEESEDLENPSHADSTETNAVSVDKLEPVDDKVPSGAGQLPSESRDKNVDPDGSSRTKKKKKKGPTIDGVILPRQGETDHEEKTFFNRFIGLDLPLWVYGLLVSLIGLIALGVYCAGPSAKASLATDGEQTRQSTEKQGPTYVEGDAEAAAANIDADEDGPGSDIPLALTEGEGVATAKMEKVVDPLALVMEAIELSRNSSLVETVRATQANMVNLLSNQSPGKDKKKYQTEVVDALWAFSDSLDKVRELSKKKGSDFWKCSRIPGAEDVASSTECKCPSGLSLQPVQDWHGAVRCLATGQTKWEKDKIGGLYNLCECAEPKVSAQCDSFALGSEARRGKPWFTSTWKASGFKNKLTADAKKALKEKEENAIKLSVHEGRQCKCPLAPRKGVFGSRKKMVLSGQDCKQQRGQVYFNILDRDVTKCHCAVDDTAIEASPSVAESVAHYQISILFMSLEDSEHLTMQMHMATGGAVTLAGALGLSIASCFVTGPICLIPIFILAPASGAVGAITPGLVDTDKADRARTLRGRRAKKAPSAPLGS